MEVLCTDSPAVLKQPPTPPPVLLGKPCRKAGSDPGALSIAEEAVEEENRFHPEPRSHLTWQPHFMLAEIRKTGQTLVLLMFCYRAHCSLPILHVFTPFEHQYCSLGTCYEVKALNANHFPGQKEIFKHFRHSVCDSEIYL